MAKDLKAMLAKKLAENNQRHADAHQETSFDPGRQHLRIALEQIDPNPYQPRRTFPPTELEALASSIAEAGLLQPISVREISGRYQIIAGERRFRAHKLLGRPSIEAIVIPTDEPDMAVWALAENIDRQDLTDYEIGKALRQVENLFPSKTKLAESLGMNREDMYRYYAFEALPETLLARLDLQPKLVSRSAAADIKRVLSANASDSGRVLLLLDEAWELLEAGQLEQTKVASYISKRLEDHKNRVLSSPRSALKLARDGQQVGSIARDSKGIVVKLKAGAISDVQAEKLQSFVQQLIAEEV
nr:putative partitioning protein ParB [uncultured bacterium]